MTQQFLNAIAALKFAVEHGQQFPTQTFEVADLEELKVYGRELLSTQSYLWKIGCKNIRYQGLKAKACWLAYGGAQLRVSIAKVAKGGNVAATSKEAYHSLNLSESCKEMAGHAIKLMDVIGYCTDLEIERVSSMRIKSNLVSARRANILEAGGILMDGTIYHIEMTGETVKDRVTGRSAMTWKILPNKAPEAVQSEMFT